LSVVLYQGVSSIGTRSLRPAVGRLDPYPATNAQTQARIAPLGDDLVRHSRASILVLVGAVFFVLIVACVNVANLMLARAIGQRREIAVRLALGASSGQIVMDLLTRGVVLGILGGAAGLLLGTWTRDLIVAMAPATIPRLHDVSVDLPVLAVAVMLSVVTGAFAGLLPALHMRNTAHTLQTTSLTASESRAVLRWRGALMSAEIAAAVILTVGAGLLVRSLVLLNQVQLGFSPDRVLTMRVNLPDSQYPTTAARIAFFDELTSRVRRLPGVQVAAYANQFPMRGDWGGLVAVDEPTGATKEDVDFQTVGGEYFATLGIPMVTGQLFTDSDRGKGPKSQPSVKPSSDG
jgi:putative ABC transport system permease protein